MVLLACIGLVGCRTERADDAITLTFPMSALGAEAELVRDQLRRFMETHEGIRVEPLDTPDSADERHQLYVQWLNAGVARPDVLQLDVIWTAEFASAGWIVPFAIDDPDFFPNVLEAAEYGGRTWGVPWFADVGMLYYRTDVLRSPPRTLAELEAMARDARARGFDIGLALQAARYEGLVTVFLEWLGAFGGRLVDATGRMRVDTPEARRALHALRDAIYTSGIVPEAALTWQEEPSRFAFQNGRALFLRNWPYAYRLMSDPEASRVAGRFGIAPMPPANGGRPTAALGGSILAVNAHSRHPEAARALVRFLTSREQMLERAARTGQLPPRPSLYDDPAFGAASILPPREARAIVAHAVARPRSPLYTELSRALQVRLHRALTGQVTVEAALAAAERDLAAIVDRPRPTRSHVPLAFWILLAILVSSGAAWATYALRSRDHLPLEASEARFAWALLSPALGAVFAIAVFPLAFTFFESLHAHDLRQPALGRVFVGLENYRTLLFDPRFRQALLHTGIFTVCSVSLELGLGLGLALLLDRSFRGRGWLRALVLLPWALPTVVAALVFRFLFEGDAGAVNTLLGDLRLVDRPIVFFGDAILAWIPIVLADVWKTTPFVALLLLAGLQTIDEEVLEAARIDGANAVRRLVHVTLPLLRPSLIVVLLFRTLDAFRIFDLVYVLTGGGPGTATEPIAFYTFEVLLQGLRFGYGSALSMWVFVFTFLLAVFTLRVLGGTGVPKR